MKLTTKKAENMEKEKYFINIEINTELPKLLNLSLNDIKVYLTVCSKMTFKREIFGVFKQKTAYEFAKQLELKDVTQLKQILKKLEKQGLLYIVNIKENLILSKTKITTDELKTIIEQNFADFNIRAERLNELKEFFNWKVDFKAIYANKTKQATTTPPAPEKSLEIDFDRDCPF